MSAPAEKPTIAPSSIVRASEDQVSCELDGEAAILDLKQEVYYGLNPVGAAVWALIAEPRRVDEIERALLAEFEVAPEQCARDLRELLGELAERGLVRIESDERPG